MSEVVTLTVMPFDRRSSQPITDADAVTWRRSRVEDNADDSHVLSGHELLRRSRKCLNSYSGKEENQAVCIENVCVVHWKGLTNQVISIS